MELRQFFFKTLIVVGTLISLYLLFQVRSLLLLFFGAILFASTVRPLVSVLAGRGIPPILSILVTYIVFLGGIAAILIVLLPAFAVNVQDLLKSQTSILAGLELALQRIREAAMTSAGVDVPIPRVAELQNYLAQFQTGMQQNFQQFFLGGVQTLSEVFIMFILAFYWLTERDHLEEWGLKMAPLRARERIRILINEIETTLGAFVRGQTVLCLVVFALSFIALTVLGVRSALVLAVFAGVVEAVPMIGPILGAIPAILVALISSPEQAIFVAIAFLVIQQFENQILVPKVMERQVGLPPMFVLLAIAAGNLLGGLMGAVVAIPIAAAFKIIVKEFVITPTMEARKMPTFEGAVLIADATDIAVTPPVESPPPSATPVGGSTTAPGGQVLVSK